MSALGWPLQAEIDLVTAPEDDIATFKARLAPPEVFKQANVQYSPALIGVRVSIERRADGQPYIKIISTRPVNEPFIDLLVELSWVQGHLVREYTALIDPPEFLQGSTIAQGVPPVEPAPAVTLESQARAPVEPIPAKPVAAKPVANALAATRPAVAPAGVGNKKYGPVKEGETLSRIANRIRPKGVTLEQMLAILYQANPEAFGNDMNVLLAGAVLRIPELQQDLAIVPAEAAEGARARAPSKEAPREVLRLSKVELPDDDKIGDVKGASRKVTEVLRALAAEVASREKVLTEANERIGQLEQTVKNMRQQMGGTRQMPGDAPAVKGDAIAQADSARADPAKIDMAKMEPGRDAGQPVAEKPGSGEQAPPAAQPASAGPTQGEPLKAEAPKAGSGAAAQPKPTNVVQTPPSLRDQILAEPLYLAGGGLLVLLGALGYSSARRRRKRVAIAPLFAPVDPRIAAAASRAATVAPRGAPVAPVIPRAATFAPPAAATVATAATAATAPATPPDTPAAADDPLAEVNLLLSFGRDERAEEILLEVLEEKPANQEAQLKLLQIYAGRNDKATFEKIAHTLRTQTNGAGENWLKAATMGRALDPENRRYEGEPSKPAVAMPGASGAAISASAKTESLPLVSTVTETAQPELPLPLPPATVTETAKPDAGAVDSSLVVQSAPLATAVEAPASAREAGVADTAVQEAAPQYAAPDMMLNLPGEMQPTAAPDKMPGAPAGESDKAGVTSDPVAPMTNTIEFETVAVAPATPDDAKDKRGRSNPPKKP